MDKARIIPQIARCLALTAWLALGPLIACAGDALHPCYLLAAEGTTGGQTFRARSNRASAGEPHNPFKLVTLRRPAASAAPRSGGRSGRLHWTFQNVDAQTLLGRLQRFGVELPVAVSGQITARVSVAVPWQSMFRPGSYQVEANIESDALTVAGFVFHRLTADAVYSGGTLSLNKASFVVPRADGGEGTFSGSAKLQVQPRGDLTGSLTLNKIPLSRIADLLPDLQGLIAGDAAGGLSLRSSVDRIRDLAAWNAQGRLTLADVRLLSLPPAQLAADFRLANGRANITKLSAGLASARLSGTASMGATAPYQFAANLKLSAPDLDWLAELDENLRPPVRVAGRLGATIDARGAVQPKQLSMTGTFTGAGLKAGPVVIDRLQAPYHIDLERIRLSQVRVDLYGGQVAATVTLPLAAEGSVGVGLRLTDVDAGALASQVAKLDQRWRGLASGTVQLRAPYARLQSPEAWSGSAQLNLRNGNANGITLSRAATALQLADGTARLEQIDVDSSLARVTGSASLGLSAPFAVNASLTIANFDVAQLNRLPPKLLPPDLQPQLPIGQPSGDGSSLAPLAGRVGLSAAVSGSLQPLKISANGSVSARGLRADRAQLDSLDFDYQLSDRELSLARIVAGGYRGRLTGSARLPLGTKGDARLSFNWRQFDIGRLTGDLGLTRRLTTGPLGAWSNGDITASASGDLLDPTDWQATASLLLWRVRFDRLTLRRASLRAELAEGTLSLTELAADQGPMRLNASAHIGVAAPYDFGLKVRLVQGDVAWAGILPRQLSPSVRVSGNVSLTADMTGSVEPLRLAGNGSLSARQLRAGGAIIDSLDFAFEGADDHLSIDHLAVAAYQGRIEGGVTVPLADDSAGHAAINWRQINIGRLATDLQLVPGRFGGWASGRFNADYRSQHAPPDERAANLNDNQAVGDEPTANTLLDPAAWTGELDVSLVGLSAWNWTDARFNLTSRLADGKLEIAKLAAQQDKTTITGSASLDLMEPYAYQAKLSILHVDLAKLNSLPGELRPPVKLAGQFGFTIDSHGTLDPLQVAGEGSFDARQIEVAGARVDRVGFEFSLDDTVAALKRFEADLYGGKITGQASIPLDNKKAGAAQPGGDEPEGDGANRTPGKIAFDWQAIDVGKLATDVAHPPVHLSGKVNGSIDVEIPPGKLRHLADWSGRVSFDAKAISAQRVDVGGVSGELTYQDRLLDYEIQGQLLDGKLLLAGRWTPLPKKGHAPVNDGRLQVTRVRLGALENISAGSGPLAELAGTLNVDVHYHHEQESGLPTGEGTLAIDDLRFNAIDVARDMRGRLRLTPQGLDLVGLTSTVAGGRLSASGTMYLEAGRRSSFFITLEDADVAELLAALSPTVPRPARGTIDMHLRGYLGLGRPIQVDGAAALRRVRIAKFDLGDVRVPIAGSIDPATGRGLLRMHGISGQLAQGRLVSDLDVTMASGIDVSGKGKFTRLDLRSLLHSFSSASRLANGKVSGVFTLAGRNVRSARDLSGTLKADLSNTQAMSMPVMERVLPFLSGGISGGTTFDDGDLRARLANGVVRIERFTLTSSSAQVYAQGSVTLAQRLRLQVTVRTGQQDTGARAAGILASRIALIAAPPVGLLMEATQFLSNQVINLDVTGTIRSPTVRIKPISMFGQDVIQFFLLEGLP